MSDNPGHEAMTIEQALQIPGAIIALFRAELQSSARDLVVEDVTERYPWVEQHSLY